MTFDDVVGQVLGLDFERALTYLDEGSGSWKVTLTSPSTTHTLSATNRDDAEAEAASWILSTYNRRVISVWVYGGSDVNGSKAIYA